MYEYKKSHSVNMAKTCSLINPDFGIVSSRHGIIAIINRNQLQFLKLS